MTASDARAAHIASLARRWTAAGILLTDDADRILMVEPTYRWEWLAPGGTTEAGESPAQACAREVREELGLDLPVGRLLVLDHRTGPSTGDVTQFVYEGGRLPAGATITLPADELRSWEFLHPQTLGARTAPHIAARMRAALDARRDGTVFELENGRRR